VSETAAWAKWNNIFYWTMAGINEKYFIK
jgi:hypothetical protein